jgi:hypothetical protein
MASNFRKAQMASEDLKTYLVSGIYLVGSTPTVCPDGACVVVGALQPHTLYTGMLDLNTRAITAPVADTDSVAFVDFVGVTQGTIQGVLYKEGIKGYGIPVPAGTKTRVRRIMKGDTFWLGSSNFAATPTVGHVFVPTAGSTVLTDSGAAVVVSGKTSILVETSQNVTEGTTNTDTEYLCTVLQAM